MAVALLSLVGAFVAFYLLAANMGWTPPVPCGTGDCATVQSSKYAKVGPVPVSGIGLAGMWGSSPSRWRACRSDSSGHG